MKEPGADVEELISKAKGVGGIILGVSGNRSWIELLYEGDFMHAKPIDLPSDALFDIFIEEIPHKCTVYEHPRTMIYFDGPCDIEVRRDGNRVIVRGSRPEEDEGTKSRREKRLGGLGKARRSSRKFKG